MQVSVIIPVYNAAPFLDKSIQSALVQKQTGEVLVIDDRSNDDSLEICKRWELKDSRVKVFVNEGTKGAGAARNVGLRHAACDYIAFLDADDYYLNDRFVYDQERFNSHFHIDYVTNSVQIQLFEQLNNDSRIGLNIERENLKLKDYFKSNGIHLNGLTIKKKVFDLIGLFDENLKQGQDKDIVLRILRDSIGCCTKNIVAIYRLHNNNTTKNYCETVYFRRKLYKKLIYDAIRYKYSIKFLFHTIKNFVAYDYIWIFGFNSFYHHLAKIILLPFFLIRICSRDPIFTDLKIIYHI